METGDLPALREQGRLRVLVPRRGKIDLLPRHGHPFDIELSFAEAFAEDIGLEPVWVWVERHDDLIPALLEGHGDLIAANLTVTADRRERLAFSDPLGYVREQVVTRASDDVAAPADLVGRTVVIRRSSSFWDSVERLRSEHAGIELVAAPEEMDTEEILHRVALGEYDVSVADDNLVVEVLAYTPELRVAFDLTDRRPVAWGMRPRAQELRDAVNRFIGNINLGRSRERHRDDLPGIRERGVLRVLTRNNASTYFIWRGELVGFEYDLARRFAERLGVRLQIVVPPTRAALLTWLRQGRGDIVAAGLTATSERLQRDIGFSRPYNYVVEEVVTRASDTTLHTPADLEGRTIAIRRSSSYWDTLEELRGEGLNFRILVVPEQLETEEIIGRVARGDYDLTVADSHILDIELTWREDIRVAFALGDTVPHAWATRAADHELLAAINDFFRHEYRGLFYNVTYNKYFRDPARALGEIGERPSLSGSISPFDDLIKAYASEYGFDWRLIAAQMYEESRFDPSARSFAGAVGLMQVLPRTAAELGIESPHLVEEGIHAGVKYLRAVYDRITDAASPEDRLWMALASYNAGYGHVRDGRRLAARMDRDPDIWFGQLNQVLPLLARSEYYDNARYGYCRCREPVRYVSNIRDRYIAYRGVLSDGVGEPVSPVAPRPGSVGPAR